MTHALRQPFLLGLLLLAATTPAAAFDLVAKPVTTTMPDGASLVVLAYVTAPDTTVAPPGGPVLTVNQGDTVTVNLTNGLAESTGIHFQGQPIVPDLAGIAPGATGTYTFTASSPGTFLYEAGLVPGTEHQAARGLHGVLIVRPTDAPAQAYASLATAFDDEAILVLGEIDPALHASASPAAFDLRDYQPWYFLLNGKAYPATDPIPTAPGRRVLIRFANAGLQQHSMTLLGAQMLLVGKDGNELAHPVLRVAETIAPGETLDAIVTVPAGTASGVKLAVFDGSLKLHNGRAAGFGG
ncbi:MAG TPA: multicopper oxidase family protein, partial [Anaeromyxobacteraceae bacterium]|nr:multicopper oxidase family protein [Anaeromyxobacteraceae bacterium]